MKIKGRPSLVTGGSGFLGRHVLRHLIELGDDVMVLGRRPVRGVSNIVVDLTHMRYDLLCKSSFGTVYHFAGLAHVVPSNQAQREKFHHVNVGGLKNLLKAIDGARELPESFVLASTVAVYGAETGSLLDEESPRMASDPYGLSKKEAEDVLMEWGSSRGVRVGVVRLPLVAGPAAPGNLGAMISALKRRRYLGIGDGAARRSMVLAVDVASALPGVAKEGGVFHLTDGHHPSFAELEEALTSALSRRRPWHLPMWAARLGGRAGECLQCVINVSVPLTTHRLMKMVSTLTFTDERARVRLGWRPSRIVDRASELVA